MKIITQMAMIAAFSCASLIPAYAQGPSAEEVEKIFAVLTEMQCEVDEGDIELEEDGYDLDDVFCADGQQDIKMNADFEVTSLRKE